MYCAYITKLKNIRKHPNADKLMLAECFGNTVVVGVNDNLDSLGVYFPVDGKLGYEFCEINNLCRKKDVEGNNIGGFLDPDKRNIKAIKLRGEKSDGLWLPIDCLDEFCDINSLKDGDTITILNGTTICEKYIPKSNKRNNITDVNKVKVKKKNSYPLFEEHVDTEQLAYNINAFKEGDICYITLKMHGTSQRSSYTVRKETSRSFFRNLFHIKSKIKEDWDYVCGTRRCVINNFDGGFYGSNEFRKAHHENFIGKLMKGETVYYEVVGFTGKNSPIMGDGSNKKINDKEFIRQYGDTTRFSYGCEDGTSDCYVYRMTITNEDGFVVEYPWELVKLRCEQMGVKYVPEFEKFIYTNSDDLMKRVEKYYDGADPIGKSHIREGVVVRIDNKPKFTAYKHKNFYFKVLEGIIKDTAIEPDIEESQELNM